MSFILVRRRWRASTQHRPLRLGLLRCRRHKGLCGGTEAHTYKRQLLLVKPLEKLFCWNQHEPKPKDYDLQGAITMTNFAHKTFYCVIPMSTVPTISEKWRWGWEHWQSGEMGRVVVIIATEEMVVVIKVVVVVVVTTNVAVPIVVWQWYEAGTEGEGAKLWTIQDISQSYLWLRTPPPCHHHTTYSTS